MRKWVTKRFTSLLFERNTLGLTGMNVPNWVVALSGALVLAVLVTGCGQGNAYLIKAIRHTRAMYGATLPSKITAAQASASNYALPVPAIPLQQEPLMKPWVSMTGKIPPADWSKYVPNIPVVNDTNGAVSDATAQKWGDALMRVRTLQYWAERYFDPNLLYASAQQSGEFSYGGMPVLNGMVNGTSATFQGLMYPEELILLPLNKTEQTSAFGVPVSSDFAFFVPQVSKTIANRGVQLVRNIHGRVIRRIPWQESFAQSYLIAGNFAAQPNNQLVKKIDGESNSVGWPFGGVWNMSEIAWCQGIGMTPALHALCATGGAIYD